MAKLTMCKGLPASGKSFWARNEAKALWGPDTTVVVTKDDIRNSAPFAKKDWNFDMEKEIIRVRDFQISEALNKGKDVISADTNLAPKHEARLREIAKKYKAEFVVKSFLDVPISTCIERDALREGKECVGEKVIRDMAEQFLTPDQLLPNRQSPQLFLDLDGVFADFDSLVKANWGWDRDPMRDTIPNDVFWNTLRTYKGRLFQDLKPMPYAKDLWEALSHYKPVILTGVARSILGCVEDKLAWVAKYVDPDVPVICATSRNKWKYAKPGDVLLDDSPKYEELWTKAGGVWITHTHPNWIASVDMVERRLEGNE